MIHFRSDTCWQVSDMGGKAFDAGALLCLLAQALVKVEVYIKFGYVQLVCNRYEKEATKKTLARAALSRISIT